MGDERGGLVERGDSTGRKLRPAFFGTFAYSGWWELPQPDR